MASLLVAMDGQTERPEGCIDESVGLLFRHRRRRRRAFLCMLLLVVTETLCTR
jgi:hypothetical protein